jgi:hypothetical protein
MHHLARNPEIQTSVKYVRSSRRARTTTTRIVVCSLLDTSVAWMFDDDSPVGIISILERSRQ